MPSTIATLFAQCRCEDLIRAAESRLRSAPGSEAAAWAQALAHYWLGEHERALDLLQRTFAGFVGLEPPAVRERLFACRARCQVELGRFEAAVETGDDPAAGAEAVLAGAWAALFLGRTGAAAERAAGLCTPAHDPYLRGRAGLCRALVARRDRDPKAEARWLHHAREDLAAAESPRGEPVPVRWLYLAQVESLLDREAPSLARALEITATEACDKRVSNALLRAVTLHRRHLSQASVEGQVPEALASGVHRLWIAILPGADAAPGAPLARPAEPAARPAARPAVPASTPVAAAPAREEWEEWVATPAAEAAPAVSPAVAVPPAPDARPKASPSPIPVAAPPEPRQVRVPSVSSPVEPPEARAPAVFEPVASPAPAPVSPTPASADAEHGAEPGTQGILLVVGDDSVAASFKDLLVGTPYSVAERARSVDRIMDKKTLLRAHFIVVDAVAPAGSHAGSAQINSVVRQIRNLVPEAKVLVLYEVATKYLVMGAIREGAVGRIPMPFDRERTLAALQQAAEAEVKAEAIGGAPLKLVRRIACSWKHADGGLRTALERWKPILAHELDPGGVEACFDQPMEVGARFLLSVEIPGAKSLEAGAEVATCSFDRNRRMHVARLAFTDLPEAEAERLKSYILAHLGAE